MKSVLSILLLSVLLFSACMCGGNSDDGSDGDDDITDDTVDDTIDDTVDDTTDDTSDDTLDDDTADDSSDDEDPAYSCLWNADLPPDNSYEWVTEKVWDLESETGDEQGLFYEENEPVIYWLEVQENTNSLYSAKKIGENWERVLLNADSQSVGAVDMELSPNGMIGVALTGQPTWTENCLSYCLFEDNEIFNCEGITDDIRGTAVKLAFQYDGRPGILIKESGNAYLVYYERDASGVWQSSFLPTVTEYQPRSFAIGPDGEAHSANTYVVCDPFDYTDCVNLSMHLHGTAGTTFGVDFLSADERIHSVSDMAVSPGNDIIAAVYRYNESPTQIAHRVSRFKWDLIQLSADNAHASGIRVSYDHDENAMVGYGFQIGTSGDTSICWARWENGQWRKEIIEEEVGQHYYYENVMDMKIDSDGNVGLLYFYSNWNNDHTDRSLMFAHRVPKYTLHPAEADK